MISYSRRDYWLEYASPAYEVRRWRFGHVELIRQADRASVYFQSEDDLAVWDADMAKLAVAHGDDPERYRFWFDQLASQYDDVMQLPEVQAAS